MPLINDPAYLREKQYTTSANLAARADLHARFSPNPYGWPRWNFDQLALRPSLRVLEVGGGPGWLWRNNLERLPELRICLSDFSPGMVYEARQALAGDACFTLAQLDAQALPFVSETFDLVVANHMLYHVPDVGRAVRELARVLQPGGRLMAATNGAQHLAEIHAIVRAFEPRYAGRPESAIEGFHLENGPDIVARALAGVEVRRYSDSLWVTEAEPLVAYIYSSWWGRVDGLDPTRRGELHAHLQARIAAEGGLRITKDTGLVIGVKA